MSGVGWGRVYSFRLSVRLFVYLFVGLFVCSYVCLFFNYIRGIQSFTLKFLRMDIAS